MNCGILAQNGTDVSAIVIFLDMRSNGLAMARKRVKAIEVCIQNVFANRNIGSGNTILHVVSLNNFFRSESTIIAMTINRRWLNGRFEYKNITYTRWYVSDFGFAAIFIG